MSVGFAPDTGGNLTEGPICVSCAGGGDWPLQISYGNYGPGGANPASVAVCPIPGGPPGNNPPGGNPTDPNPPLGNPPVPSPPGSNPPQSCSSGIARRAGG